MSMPLLYERLISLSTLQSSLLVELALLPSPRGLPMSMPLPSEHLTFPLILKNEFSAPQSSVISRQLVELAWRPSPRGSPMSMPLPSELSR